MQGPMLLLSATLLFLLAAARGQEVCSDAENVTTMYNGNANMNCGVRLTYRWWRSNDQCQSFVEHSSCNTNRSCFPAVNDSLERYYHFCCTDDSVTGGSQVATSGPTCFRIRICTDISNEVAPPVVFLGATEKIYVFLFGEPPPTDTPQLKLINTTTSLSLTVQPSAPQQEFFYLDRTSELTFIYTFAIPDTDDNPAVNDIGLEFSTQFNAPLGTCQGRRDITIDIPVRRTRTTSTPVPTSTSFPPPPPTTATPTATPCRSVSGLAIGFIVFSVVLLVLMVVMAVVLIVVCWKLLQQRKSTSPSDPSRPPSLPINQYRPLRQTSMTPGTPLPAIPVVVTTETTVTGTPTTTLTTASQSPYETIPQGSTGNTDETVNGTMSESRSMDLEINQNAVDDTDSAQVTTNSEPSLMARNPVALYDEYIGDLQNPGPVRNV